MDEWTNGHTDGCIDEKMNIYKTDEWVTGWMDGWMDGDSPDDTECGG